MCLALLNLLAVTSSDGLPAADEYYDIGEIHQQVTTTSPDA